MDGVAQPEHRHMTDGSTIDMNTPHFVAHLHPDASAVDAELHQGPGRLIDKHEHPAVVTAHATDTRRQHQVTVLAIGKLQSDGIHASAI
jgi:hypothetical protein